MVRFLLLILVGLCSLLYAAEEPVALSGTVKDNAGTALEGVTVTLAKIKNLSAVTKTNGSFTLTNVTSVLRPANQKSSFSLTFKNNCFVFTSPTGKISGTISIFSGEGRLISTINLNNITTEQKQVALPELSSGMYLLAGKVGGESFTQPLVCMGNNIYLRSKTMETQNNGLFSLKKRAAVVDTLIASKVDYDTARVPLNSYSSDTIKIVLAKKGVFAITSTKFVDGDSMPDQYTCEGKSFTGSIAPPIEWSGIPAAAKSLALFFKDLTIAATPDPRNAYHWAMWNIPITVTKMPEGLGNVASPPEMGGAQQKSAMNGNYKFFGPCPSGTNSTRAKDTYALILYAFDKDKITPSTNATVQELDKFFDANDIAKTQISVWSDAKATGF